MSLYDDDDGMMKDKSEQVAGWSSGIKLMQSQMQLKQKNPAQSVKSDNIFLGCYLQKYLKILILIHHLNKFSQLGYLKDFQNVYGQVSKFLP